MNLISLKNLRCIILKIILLLTLLNVINSMDTENNNPKTKILLPNFQDKNPNEYSGIDDTFKLLEDGEISLNLGEHRDIILVLGNTGSGKSTLTHFIAGDNNKLRSVEVETGTGEYIIEDDNDKIGHGIYSKTVIPERVIHPESDVAYYDCPGFSDTRNAAFDIASTYFIKKTLDYAKSVKLLFTISYSSVRIGVDRNDFMKLVTHTTEFINNVEKFKNSIALVITKVDNQYINRGETLVSDDKIVNKIVKYIQGVKETLIGTLSNTNNLKEKLFYKNAIGLIDIFLTKNKFGYKYIMLFRRPDEAGILTENALLQDGKKKMFKLIENDLMFTQKNLYDFGFTISASSKNSILKLMDNINDKITEDVTETTYDIKEYFNYKIKNTYDIHQLKNDIDMEYSNITNLIPEFERTSTYKEFVIKFIDFMNDMDVKSARKVFITMFNKYKYLIFLQLVSKEHFKAKASMWIHPLQSVVEYISETRSWYIFLVDLREKLSNYNAYKNAREENILQKFTTRQKRNIDSTDMEKIFDVLKDYNLNEYNNVKNIPKDSVKLIELNRILRSLLENNIDVYCNGLESLIIKGAFIKFSDIPSTNPCKNNIKFIKLFALNTVFIDKDLIRIGDKLKVLIISPKWEIIGDRKIVLDGISGVSHTWKKAAISQDGKPGLPGGAAGSFIGIGQKIINAEHLTIHANGGRGGEGQEGGDGLPGIDGNTERPWGLESTGLSIMSKTGYTLLYGNTEKSVEHPIELFGYILGFNADLIVKEYLHKGQGGTKGGDGGKGGASGKGGPKGAVFLYGLDKGSEVSILNQNGYNGSVGNGGKGGLGGKNDDDLLYTYREKDKFWFWARRGRELRGWYESKRVPVGRALDGAYNTQINNKDINNPENEIIIQNASHEINSYKTYLLNNINNYAKIHDLMKFYFHIDNNPHITDMYDSFGLFNELQNLENHVSKLNSEIELENIYRLLLNKINVYAKKPKYYELTVNHKIFLNYLYTATLSKILTFNNKSENNLILNIDGYFSLMLSNFKELQNYENEIVKNEYNYNFKKEIDVKIKDAISLIENHIVFDVDIITAQIERTIDTLIDEIIQLKQNTVIQKEELVIKQTELAKEIERRGIFESLKFIKNILRFLGPIAEIASERFQEINQVSDFLAVDKDVNSMPAFSIPQRIHSLIENGLNFAENYVQKKSDAFSRNLNTIHETINKNSNEWEDLRSTVSSIKSNLTTYDQNDDFDLLRIIKLNENVTNSLTNKVNDIGDNHLHSVPSNNTNLTDILKNLNTTHNVVKLFTDVYLKYKDDNEKFSQISEAIQIYDKNIIALQQYQLHIYETVVPLFKTMRNDIINYEKELPLKSRVALDVSKWKIQDLLNGMKMLLGKITVKFKIEDELKCFVDKLNEAMSILINTYDRIENYNEQKELADYIADINSVRTNEIKTSNKTINDALLELEYIIKSHIVLDQYEKAMTSFKQFIFPFANYYLNDYKVPFHINMQPNIENLLTNASKKINSLKSKLTENSLLLNRNFDQYVFEEYFQAGKKYSGPFYIWENYKYENTISKFLSGEEIILKADIINSIHDKNAIKFNKIRINLRSRDKSVSNIITEKLNYFDITMKHFGNSYFRCDNKFYLLSSDIQTFYYSFENDVDGEPLRKNLVYTKIKNGQYMLSPYATWSFKLKNSLNTDFAELNILKGKIDLELTGHGQYVSSENNICGRDLKQYYKTDNTISITDVIHEEEVNSNDNLV